MPDFSKIAKTYALKQIDKPTAWIGAIGLTLQFLTLNSWMFLLFVALIILPMDSFEKLFAEWAKKVRTWDAA